MKKKSRDTVPLPSEATGLEEADVVRERHELVHVDVPQDSLYILSGSVGDQDSDPYVFGPSGSGSFYRQAKRKRKTLIPTFYLRKMM
jgi:hypothetical protein